MDLLPSCLCPAPPATLLLARTPSPHYHCTLRVCITHPHPHCELWSMVFCRACVCPQPPNWAPTQHFTAQPFPHSSVSSDCCCCVCGSMYYCSPHTPTLLPIGTIQQTPTYYFTHIFAAPRTLHIILPVLPTHLPPPPYLLCLLPTTCCDW